MGGWEAGGVRRFERSKVWQKGCWRTDAGSGLSLDVVRVRFGSEGAFD